MTLLARMTVVNHAEVATRVPAFGAETALIPHAWNPASTAGAAALKHEILRQALVLAYLDDFRLLMWLTVVALPLVFFLRARNTAPTRETGPPH